MLPSANSHAAMYGTIHSYSGGYDWRHVSGSLDTPNPTNVADGSHKTYMVYFSTGLSPFTAGSGIYIFKNAGQPIVKCHLMLFVNDYASDNSNYLDCSPAPSGTVSIKIEQTADDGTSFKGTSGGNTFTYAYTQNPSTQPPNYGAAAGGTTNNLDMYSFFSNLKVKTWAGTEYTFANTPTNLYKCYVDSGYKYDNQNHNTMISGPPALTIDDWTSGLESQAFGPHEEWD